ncbi:MAG: endonuclease [Gemmatimonadetes bacterium]|nr:endonuclease [Gemmatimonadota bacterium]HCK08566.1 endonuclease [Candidatus Latescibacterota bacterium]
MRVMTCNIRTSTAADGEDHWERRKAICVSTILDREPDLFGVQEAQEDQLIYLTAAMSKFSSFGLPDEAAGRNAVNTIFYRSDRFDSIAEGGYWMSETPHVPGSSSWESACVRLANWVRLKDRESGHEFRFVNTHLDHVSQPAVEGQVAKINEDAAAYPEVYPQILTGDMNARASHPGIQALLAAGWADTYETVHADYDPGNTFHRFRGDQYEGESGKIDWIFCRGNVQVKGAEIVRDSEGGRFPSDHYFIMADCEVGGC